MTARTIWDIESTLNLSMTVVIDPNVVLINSSVHKVMQYSNTVK